MDSDQGQQCRMLELARELMDIVLSNLHPCDITSFGRTSKHAYESIRSSNNHLWKNAFLNVFDNPYSSWARLQPSTKSTVLQRDWNWYSELRERLTVLSVLKDTDAQPGHDITETSFTRTILEIFDTADQPAPSSLNLKLLTDVFSNYANTDRFIHDFHPEHRQAQSCKDEVTSIPGRPTTRSMVSSAKPHPDSSRLHVLHGLTARERSSRKCKGAARKLVYDWTLTGPQADYGCFLSNHSGEVDWAMLEACTSLMRHNFTALTMGHLSVPNSFMGNVPGLLPQLPTDPKEDWAGVTRPWIGTYSFLDYGDLYHFNLAHHHPGIRPELEDYDEACGDLLRLDLQLDPSLGEKQDERLKTNVPPCDDLPVLYFSGTSRGHGSRRPTIAMRGCASLVKGGREVRWRYIVRYGGADQWQLEGVQPGGIRSGGIFGIWSHCDHDENGPVGPFCYYPLELCEIDGQSATGMDI